MRARGKQDMSGLPLSLSGLIISILARVYVFLYLRVSVFICETVEGQRGQMKTMSRSYCSDVIRFAEDGAEVT